MPFWKKLNSFLSKYMFVCVFAGLFLGSLFPLEQSPLLQKLVIVLFAYMTFVTALGTSLRQFGQILRHPRIPLLILVLVHFVAPVVAWAVGTIFYPNEPYTRMGYLIGAAIPIGVTSVIWTALVKGNLPVSLVSVTLDTFVVPIVLPAFFVVVIGQSVKIDYWQMIVDLALMVTIPSTLGMFLYDISGGKVRQFAENIGGVTSKLCMVSVILINSSLVLPQIDWNISIIKMMVISLFIVATGFFVGYLGSFLMEDRTKESVLTIIFNVGIRNNACGLVLALSYFPPSVAIPLTLSVLYQQPIATLVPHIFNYFEYTKAKQQTVQEV